MPSPTSGHSSAPIWQLGGLASVGPRVGQSTIGLIAGYPCTSPYADITPNHI
jgi:hypothetical protein